MPNANEKPEPIFLDYVRDGQCRLLVRWNITEVTTDDPMEKEPRTSYNYSERVIWWTIPKPYASLAEVADYLDSVGEEIINWAMATDTKFDGTTAKDYQSKSG
jgi:hypothetical protein